MAPCGPGPPTRVYAPRRARSPQIYYRRALTPLLRLERPPRSRGDAENRASTRPKVHVKTALPPPACRAAITPGARATYPCTPLHAARGAPRRGPRCAKSPIPPRATSPSFAARLQPPPPHSFSVDLATQPPWTSARPLTTAAHPSLPPAAPAAPAAEVAKPADAKEDLDKKMNTLFKSSRK